MVCKLNEHYSMTCPGSVYDEEALTALELAGRTTAKVNEVVEYVNTLPEQVTDEVQNQIDNGTFDKQVGKYAGELQKQVSDAETRLETQQNAYEKRINSELDALDARIDTFVKLPNGSTTGDAELQDLRVWTNGNTSNTAGEAVRGQLNELQREAYQAAANFGYVGWNDPFDFTVYYRHETHGVCLKINFNDTIGVRHRGSNIQTNFDNTYFAELTEYITFIDGTHATLYIPTYNSLVFNVTDMQFHFRTPASNMKTNDVPLIKTAYGYPIGGTLMDTWTVQRTKAQEGRLNALEATEPAFAGNTATWQYASLFNGTGDIEKFIFFTDPHLCQETGWEAEFFEYMSEMKKHHDVATSDFVICGGDWLGNNDPQDRACYKLSFIDAQMRKLFPRYYHVVGNHDTNYQGVDSTGAANTGMLPRETVRNLWFNDQGKNYYTFKGANTTFFVFDTDLDWDAYKGEMIPYYNEQLSWFIAETEKCQGNIALVFHIARVVEADERIHPLVTHVCNYSAGYNARHTDSKVRFALAGHMHVDIMQTISGIPVITTTNMRDGGVPTFDLCLADYTNNVLHMVRVGTGESRTVNI